MTPDPEWRRITVAPGQVAAGQGVTVPMPESEQQKLVAVTFRIVASAAVATRTPTVSVLDGSGVAVMVVPAGINVTAGQTMDFTFAYGLASWSSATAATAAGALPQLPLAPGDNIAITVAAIDVADQISRVRVTLLQRSVRP